MGRELAGDQDPIYLFLLCLPQIVSCSITIPMSCTFGDELRCPQTQEFAAFASMPQSERRAVYRRLTAYGERLKRQ